MEPAVPWDGRRGGCPLSSGPGIPAMPLVRAPVTPGPSIPTMLLVRTPVTTWLISHFTTRVGGCTCRKNRFLGRCPPVLGLVALRGCPPVPSGTATRPPRRARSQRGQKAPPGADPWPPEPPQPCCTLGNGHIKSHPATRGGEKLNG